MAGISYIAISDERNATTMRMRTLILVPDGCGDETIPSLGGKTPLEAAHMPHINRLAAVSQTGLVRTIPPGAEPGSVPANLAILGYDGVEVGRAPLEAAAMGFDMTPAETAYRANLVTLEGGVVYSQLTMKDHSAGEISGADAGTLMAFLHAKLGGAGLRFSPGVGYRALMISDTLDPGCRFTPPHDILGKTIGDYLPSGAGSQAFIELMTRSYELLREHPLNQERIKQGQNPANSLWFWDQGKKPFLTSFAEKYYLTGSVITAVNLLKGIGLCAGLSCPAVPGATGTLRTNYEGKARAAIEAFEAGRDFVFIHVEAPDECSHAGDLAGKLQSLAWIDERVFKPAADYLKNTGEPYRILVLPDHKTLLSTRTHDAGPVPFVLYDSQNEQPADNGKAFSETVGARGLFFESGAKLADYFFRTSL